MKKLYREDWLGIFIFILYLIMVYIIIPLTIYFGPVILKIIMVGISFPMICVLIEIYKDYIEELFE
ncbi:MAG: hypothetical protein GF365_01075 [Candidatus Buchananbacteria bacterium]|nr:hypothetical protein [Candidatus Buchananbacteria bacterium]